MSLVDGVLEVLNASLSKNALTDTISPATIVEGRPKIDFKIDMIYLGSYALVYIDTSNDTKPIVVPSISLRTSNSARTLFYESPLRKVNTWIYM